MIQADACSPPIAVGASSRATLQPGVRRARINGAARTVFIIVAAAAVALIVAAGVG
jgi:hypothetical protein